MKKIFMIISVLLLVAMLPLSLFGCGEETEEPTESLPEENSSETQGTEKVTESGSNDPTDKVIMERKIDLGKYNTLVKRLGRTALTSSGIACDHTASGVEFKGVMQGKVKVKITSMSVKSNSPKSYFTVYIDGVRQSTRYEVQYTKVITVANFATQGEHTIKIVKQSETNYTLAEFKEIQFTGYLLDRPADKELYIEMIGDSITCGMGNIGVNGCSEPQSATWEDGSQSYGYMMAEALDADYSIISESGIGVSGSWGDHSIFDLYTKASYKRDQTKEHEFERVPDLVIVNLGTNDYFLNKDKSSTMCTTTDVVTKGKEFVQLIRTKYGENVPIICTVGLIPIKQPYVDAIQQVVTELGGEAKGIYFKALAKGALGGGQNHPVVADNVNTKNVLLSLIDEKGILG